MHPIAIVCFFIGLGIFGPGRAASQENYQYQTSLFVTGSYVKLQLAGSYLYAANRWGLQIFDRAKLQRVGQFPSADEAFGLTIANAHAFVADRDAGLAVIDIRQPGQPRPLSNFDTPGGTNAIAVSRDFAFLADSENGLVILNIQDIMRPQFVAHLPLPEDQTGSRALGAAVFGDYVYLAAQATGVLIIEVSNPSAPRLISILDTEGWAHDLVIRPPLAFIADRQNGLVIADISRPEQPSVIGGFLPNQNSGIGTSLTFGVAVVQNNVYITDTKSSFIEGEPPPLSLSILDISNPAEPQLLGGYYSGGEAVAIAVDSARVAFLALGDMGIQAVDVRQPQSPQLLARYEKPGSVQDLVVQNDFGYAALGTGGLGVFSLPDGPQEVRTLRLSAFEQARSVAANLNRLYVGKNTNAISVFDITQPETPVPLRDLPLPAGIGQDLTIDAIAATPEVLLAGYTNSARATGGLLIWRLLSPDSLQFMSGLQLFSSVHQLRIEGDLALLAAGAGGAVVVDVQDARAPKLISQIPANDFVRDATALQGLLGIADGQAGFRLFDVQNPGQPQPLGQFPTTGSTYGVFMENETAYLANFFGPMALTLLNIRNPQQPERIEIHDTPGFAIKILKHKKQLFVVDTYDLAIFQTGITGVPRAPRRESSNLPLHMLRVYPNPFNPQTRVEFMLASAAHVSLIIYNTSGQQIREIIAPTILPAGKHITTWDGKDDAGRKVSSGVYICDLRFNRFHQSQKILFIQ